MSIFPFCKGVASSEMSKNSSYGWNDPKKGKGSKDLVGQRRENPQQLKAST